MEKYPLVSMIIPVYNVEEYLPRCLESLREQTWPALEIWLVNDGSTDGSLALCRAAEAEDARFNVIDQENAGVSAARNAALDRVTGKYVQFLDADDWLPADSTEALARAAASAGADLVVGHFYRVNGDRMAVHGHIQGQQLMTRQEYAEEMLKAPANFYYGVLWNKLYSRTLLETHHLRCAEDMNWCEDFLFNLEYLKYARLIQAIPTPVYYYFKRSDSLVNGHISIRRTIDMKRRTFVCYKQLYQQLDLYEEQKADVYRYLVSSAVDGIVPPPAPDFLDELRGRMEPEILERREQRRTEQKARRAQAEENRELKQAKAELQQRLKQMKAEADLLERRARREAAQLARQENRTQILAERQARQELRQWEKQEQREMEQQEKLQRQELREAQRRARREEHA